MLSIFEPLCSSKKVELKFTIVQGLQISKSRLLKDGDQELIQVQPLDLDRIYLLGTLPPVLLGDERRLKQVLINLVKNAKKFTTRGKIEILASYSV